MHFEYSKNPDIIKRVNKLKKARFIFLVIIVLSIINYVIFSLNKNIDINTVFLVSMGFIIVVIIISTLYHYYISIVIKEALEKELYPELFLNLSIWSSKIKLTNKKNYYNSLNNIALAYICDGKYDEAKEVLDYLEKQKLDKLSKTLYLLRRIEWLFYKKKYKNIKDLKDDILYEMDGLDQSFKTRILSKLEMYSAMIEKDKKKLEVISNNLENSDINIDRVYSIYIKSLFFEEDDNKYQKMLAFEGGNLYIARKEYEDHNISTKNNMKPNKHKFIKIGAYLVLLSQIIIFGISIITVFF